jgi:hypothetical protein
MHHERDKNVLMVLLQGVSKMAYAKHLAGCLAERLDKHKVFFLEPFHPGISEKEQNSDMWP